MKDGLVECGGVGIQIRKVMEIDFPVTPEELESLAKKLRALKVGDRTKVFEANGEFEVHHD